MSWIVTDPKTGKAVCEIFNAALASKVNRQKYRVQEAGEYLGELNAKIKLESRGQNQ